ncbi:putative quinol monooxygenase [Pseudonocardia xishanensis]|uniref:ABM domain-containing protein n=1 Tax=Pseudonocardia xishanensis TaxID=630995 RepID=A0ABP8RS41_9PSEU
MSARVGRYVRMVATPGDGPALAEGLLKVAEGMRSAPGCELYIVNRTPDEEDAVWVTEVWADEASSDAALNQDLGEAGLGAILPLLAGPPEFIELAPVGGPGLA